MLLLVVCTPTSSFSTVRKANFLEFILFQAPCEAEASCAALVKSGKVFATATEDMDGLTFGTNVLLRHLTASEAK